MARYTPEKCADIEQIVREALQNQKSLQITGYGTKKNLGGRVLAHDEISLSAHSGITDYQPEELVMVARSGTPLTEIEETLDKHGQMLAFEPPHLDKLYGQSTPGSLGGVIACNLSGSRRISVGAARDYLLGFDAISGRAGYFRSGSKVMKNVTGYDLSKLMCGSFGMLAVMSEITLKVLPRPEFTTSVSVTCASLAEAHSAMSISFGSATEPSGGAIIKSGGGFKAVLRLEGVKISVNDRISALSTLLEKIGTLRHMSAEESIKFWKMMRDITCLRKDAEQVWKLSVTPSYAPQIITELEATFRVDYALDWAGGLIWLGGEGEDLGAVIRAVLARQDGGHATLMRAPEAIRASQPVFQPLDTALGGLQARIKTAFDPMNILNPQKTEIGGKADANAL